MFKKGNGDWKQYRHLGTYTEVDFHYDQSRSREISYSEKMDNVYSKALDALEMAFRNGTQYVIFTHGHLT